MRVRGIQSDRSVAQDNGSCREEHEIGVMLAAESDIGRHQVEIRRVSGNGLETLLFNLGRQTDLHTHGDSKPAGGPCKA